MTDLTTDEKIVPEAADILTVLAHAGGQLDREGLRRALGRDLVHYASTIKAMVGLRYVDAYDPSRRGHQGPRVYQLTADGLKYARPTFVLDNTAAWAWLLAGDDPAAYLEYGLDEDWGADGELGDTVTRDIARFLADLADVDGGPLSSQAGYRVTVLPVAGTETEEWEYVTVVETPNRGSIVSSHGPDQLRRLVDLTSEPSAGDAGVERLLVAASRVIAEANLMVRDSLGLD